MTLGGPYDDCFQNLSETKIGVAVSGGGDSVALLCAFSGVAKRKGIEVFVYSVDHGLRDAAQDEVRFVSEICQRLGHPHRALSWAWDGTGNLSAAARKGRYDVIATAAKADGVACVLLGHTKDDQAETVLMALSRSAGVDGLSAMGQSKQDRGITWQRPFLVVSRAALRDYLKDIGQTWVDDPTNDDDRYERVKMRKAAQALAELGITPEALSGVAENMQAVRAALVRATKDAWAKSCSEKGGAIRIDWDAFAQLDFEIRRRLIVKILGFVAPTAKPARREVIERAVNARKGAENLSVAGCLILFKSDHIWVVREPNAVADPVGLNVALWDGKWVISGPKSDQGVVIRALGEEGLKYLENWKETGVPRPALLSSPSIWGADRLIAAPIGGYGGKWSAKLLLDVEDYLS